MSKVPVYFVASKSNYYKLDCDCYDIVRDSLSTVSRIPGIYHPPCRNWSKLRKMSNFYPGERWLAIWSLIRVRRYGGVLEHPTGSLLFKKYIVHPKNGLDQYGGFSICVNQHWFGFKAEKSTMLYIVGIDPNQLPKYPLSFDCVTHSVCNSRGKSFKKELSKKARSITTLSFNQYLLDIVNRIIINKSI
jgi:hypothetical protein